MDNAPEHIQKHLYKLKKYSHCSRCRNYEEGGYKKDGFCTLGFPLEKTEQFKTWRELHGDPSNEMMCNQRPKYGCLQKNYNGCPSFDIGEARKIAIDLINYDMQKENQNKS